jgi:hypothetical protein
MRIIFNRFLKLLKIYDMDMYQYITNRAHEYVNLMDVIEGHFSASHYRTKEKDLDYLINKYWYPCFCEFAKYDGILLKKFCITELIKFNTILWNDDELLNFYLNYGKEKEIK